MRIGKPRPEVLEKIVLSRTGYRDPRVVLGGAVGEDAAIVDLGSGDLLVAHTDPITGSLELLGVLGVVIPSNDIATRGVRPSWALTTIFLPPWSGEDVLDRVTRQLHETSERLGIAIIGGHTEYTDAVSRPVVVTTAIGLGKRDSILMTRGCRPGEKILMTKWAGIEGTAILATDFRDLLLEKGVPESVLERASGLHKEISVIDEALLLTENRLVTAMHDPTEGGVLSGLIELAYASGNSVIVYRDRIPVSPETRTVTEALGIDPLTILGSGSLLATIKRGYEDEALRILRRRGIDAEIIGEVVEKRDYYVRLVSGSREVFYRDLYIEDPVIRLFNEALARRRQGSGET